MWICKVAMKYVRVQFRFENLRVLFFNFLKSSGEIVGEATDIGVSKASR